MSEVLAKPLKRVLISRKLAFVVGIVAAVGLVGVMAYSEYRHNAKKTEQAATEKTKEAEQIAAEPAGSGLDAVLATQKEQAARQAAEQEQQAPAQQAAGTSREIEALQAELSKQAAANGNPHEQGKVSPEEMRRAKEEEMAIAAYGSTMVALGKGNGPRGVVVGVTEEAYGATSAPARAAAGAGTGGLTAQDLQLLRDSQGQAAAPSAQDQNRSYLAKTVVNKGEIFVEAGRTGRILHEGSVIPSVVSRAINSDLPGQIELRTTRDVYDSVNATVLVVPRGTRAIGAYNSNINAGQDRVLVTFHRLIFPDGRNVYLGNAMGADREGASGFHDKVNTHFWEMLGSSVLLAAIAYAAENSGDNTTVNIGDNSTSNAQSSAGQIMVNTSQTALGKYTNMQPTIEIRPGTRVNILVNKDIVL